MCCLEVTKLGQTSQTLATLPNICSALFCARCHDSSANTGKSSTSVSGIYLSLGEDVVGGEDEERESASSLARLVGSANNLVMSRLSE